jgi:hypothetical protein
VRAASTAFVDSTISGPRNWANSSAAKPIAIARDIWPTAAPPSARGANAAQHGPTGAPDAGLGVPMLDRRSPERDDSVTAVA